VFKDMPQFVRDERRVILNRLPTTAHYTTVRGTHVCHYFVGRS